MGLFKETIKDFARLIIQDELSAKDKFRDIQSKFVRLSASVMNVDADINHQLELEMSTISKHALSLQKENERLKAQLYSKNKVFMPKGLFKAVADYLPDPNFVANTKTEIVNEKLSKWSSLFYSDCLGSHIVKGKVSDNDETGYNSYNTKILTMYIGGYELIFDVRLVKTTVKMTVVGSVEITTFVWVLSENVQLVSEEAWGALMAFSKTNKELRYESGKQ